MRRISLVDFSDEVVERLWTAVERHRVSPIVVKTHSRLTPAARRLLENGNAIGHCSYRDPREVILSLLDAGDKARQLGLEGLFLPRPRSNSPPSR